MFKGKINWLLLLLLPAAFIGWYFYSKKEHKPIRTLAYFGPKNYRKKQDTSYHTIPPFFFIDQFGEKVTENEVKGKVYVTDFFFTTCQSICPIMSTSLERVYKKFKDRSDFLVLSHTVDPETDSVKQLMEYSKLHGVSDKKWLFLTGEKKHLYDIARRGYLLNAEEGDGGEDDFIHTQNFALIDKERHIRGFYDGTDSLEINRLIVDLKCLFDEYEFKEKK
jgi:protein SCO1/2